MPRPRSSASCATSTTVTGIPALAKFMAMPPPMVPAPITAAFLISLAGVSGGTSGILAASRSAKKKSLRFRFRRVEELDEQFPLALDALIERQADRRLDGLDDALGRPEAARLPRHALAELREDLRFAPGGRDLVGEVTDLPERTLLVEHLLGEGHAGGGKIAVHDLVDEPDPECLVGADGAAADHHLQALLDAHHARQPLRAARAGQNPQLHLGQTEAGALHADAVVTGERDLETAAEGRAVDGGHDGLRRALDQIQHRVERRLRGRLAELGDVGAGDEGASGADDDDGLHGAVGSRLLDPVVQSL